LHRIILLLIVIGLVFYFVHRYKRLNASRKKHSLRLLVLSVSIGVIVMLALAGKLSWIIAAFGVLLPLLPRMARLLMRFWPTLHPYLQRYQQNRQSSMQSRFVSLQIDMLSGGLKGEVLAGEHAGRSLQSLRIDELLQLLETYRQDDPESAALLSAYLDRVHAGWAGNDSADFKQADTDFSMELQQARDILGVADEANKKEIVKAHKRLMQKLHPDRGGSDYLAQQINKARDLLLKNIE